MFGLFAMILAAFYITKPPKAGWNAEPRRPMRGGMNSARSILIPGALRARQAADLMGNVRIGNRAKAVLKADLHARAAIGLTVTERI